MAWFRWDNDLLYLDLHVQPRAAKSEFAGTHGERLKLRIAAAPVDGAANAAVVEFLAAEFGVAKRQVELVAGEASREKRVRITAPRVMPRTLLALRR